MRLMRLCALALFLCVLVSRPTPVMAYDCGQCHVVEAQGCFARVECWDAYCFEAEACILAQNCTLVDWCMEQEAGASYLVQCC